MPKAFSLAIRYSLIILLTLFYQSFVIVLLPLTLYSSYSLISLFYTAFVQGNSIFFNSHQIELINPCLSILAYLLLIVLNLSVEMRLSKRLKSISFSLLAFFAFNVIRIFFLSVIFSYDFAIFDELHLFFWYFANILAVLFIWILTIRLFSIKEVPFASDFRKLYLHARPN